MELGKIFFEIVKQTARFYGRITFEHKYKYQTVFSVRFDKEDENDQLIDAVKLKINFILLKN